MIYNPTFNGSAIFGIAVTMVQVPDEAACQLDGFFGVPGLLALYGNTRGRTFQIRGTLFDTSIAAVVAKSYIFLPTAPNNIVGAVGTLQDTQGNSWENVLYLGHFVAECGYPKPAVITDSGGDLLSGYCLPYQLTMRGLG
jgi:hypothetical protein